MSRLSNRNALVSGGAQGLGRAIARRLAEEGARVTVADLNEEKGRECVELIAAAAGIAQFVKANVAKRDDIEAAVRAAAIDHRLDILVNAAQFFAMPKALELVSDKDWELSEATGPKATFRFMQTAFPFLRVTGRASVINFVSGSALAGIAYTAPYSAAKGAVAGADQGCRQRVGPTRYPGQRGMSLRADRRPARHDRHRVGQLHPHRGRFADETRRRPRSRDRPRGGVSCQRRCGLRHRHRPTHRRRHDRVVHRRLLAIARRVQVTVGALSYQLATASYFSVISTLV